MFVLIVLTVLIVPLLLYGLFVLTSVGRFAKFWASQNDKPRDKGAYMMVALGDSTVQGIGATSPYKGFVGQLAKEIEVTRGESVQVYNYSKSGDRASDVVDNQLSNKDKFQQANVIVVSVGSNDITKGVSKDEYIKNVSKIFDALPAEKVVMATIPPLERSKFSKATVQEWNKDLQALVKAKKVRLAPVYNAIDPRSRDPRIYSIDLYHPSNIGYRLWAGAFYPPVSEVLSGE